MKLTWTRHKPGLWTSGIYTITRRAGSLGSWRVLRNGAFWDLIPSLIDAKAACARDTERRARSERLEQADRDRIQGRFESLPKGYSLPADEDGAYGVDPDD